MTTVSWKRPYLTDDLTLLWESRCGKFVIEKMAKSAWRTSRYVLAFARGQRAAETRHATLAEARKQADAQAARMARADEKNRLFGVRYSTGWPGARP